MITSLQGHEGEVTDQKEMLTIATGFYKTLFGYEAKPNIHLKSSFWNDEEKLSKRILCYPHLFLRKKLELLYLILMLMEHQGLMASLSSFIRGFGT